MGSFYLGRRWQTQWARWSFLAITLSVLSGASATFADTDPAEIKVAARIDAHLAVGEFAPALTLAQAMDAGERRDLALGRIASAQRQQGVRRGSLATLRLISDDQVRAQVVDDVLAVRFEGQPFLAQFGDDGGGNGGSINSQAEFDDVIGLIESTIEPDTWEANGGAGRIGEFETGVRVDAEGELHRVLQLGRRSSLARLRSASLSEGRNDDVRQRSRLRKISLPRIERQIQLQIAEGRGANEVMRNLAGMERIQYVFVYPDTRDLIIAGPAGDWKPGDGSGPVSTETGRPLLQLDDLVVMLRMMRGQEEIRFGCSITPTKVGLARTRELSERSRGTRLAKGEAARERWVQSIRDAMGRQSIDIYGIDPRTRAANVIVQADYHMKLVGMGLEPGAGGLKSYLDSIHLKEKQAPPPLGVLRWWFAMNYQAIHATEEGNAFELRGQGVQVLAENERVTKDGRRIHTGKADKLTAGFARGFTSNYPRLIEKYPMYADLQNLFDLALVAALFKKRQLPELVDWRLTCFDNPRQYRVALGEAPKSVASVINYRSFPGGQIIAGVSGGVRVDPASLVADDAIRVSNSDELVRNRVYAKPPKEIDRWWWD